MKLTKAYIPGEVYPTNHGSLVIKSNSERMNFRWVRFINTGFEREARIDHIKNGKVGDVYHPTVHGVGYLGEGKYKCKVKVKGLWKPYRPYSIWAAMIQRCYQDGIGVKGYEHCSVDPEWHCFQTFAHDIQFLEGFDKWLNEEDNYQLDKDKFDTLKEGIYSFSNCSFVHHKDNQGFKSL